MTTIRRNTILSTLVSYFGFILGGINTFLFVHQSYFSPAEYGLTRLFIDFGVLFYSLANMGFLYSFVKFSPLYKKINPEHHNTELLQQFFVIAHLGFIIFTGLAIYFKPTIVGFFAHKSPLINDYYYWFFVFSWGMLLMGIMEQYAFTENRVVQFNIFKEIIYRSLVLILVMMVMCKIFNVPDFMIGYALSYPLVAFALIAYEFYRHPIRRSVPLYSTTSQKLKKRIGLFTLFNFFATFSLTLTMVIDSILIASISTNGLADAGIFSIASFIVSIMLVPQRNLNAVSASKIFESLQQKNMNEVSRIYKRASLNLFLFGAFFLLLVLLVFDSLFQLPFLHIHPSYQGAKMAILIMGVAKLFDMLTSVNTYIILGSKYWRYELYINTILVLLSVPLNYFLILHYGILGAAFTNFITLFCINTIRCIFIWVKFSIHPFSIKMLHFAVLALGVFASLHYGFQWASPLVSVCVKPVFFGICVLGATYYFNISPDLDPVIKTLKQRTEKYFL